MPQYKAPLRDMQFVLHELLNAEQHYANLPAFSDTVSRELVDQYLEAAADFCENELSPLNQVGDREGCTWNDGVVTTPSFQVQPSRSPTWLRGESSFSQKSAAASKY